MYFFSSCSFASSPYFSDETDVGGVVTGVVFIERSISNFKGLGSIGMNLHQEK
jgi:hypothetical protein